MAVYTRSQTTQDSQQSAEPLLKSKSLSDVIVKSLAQIAESEDEDSESEEKYADGDLAETISKGIDESSIGKKTSEKQHPKQTAPKMPSDMAKLLISKKSNAESDLAKLLKAKPQASRSRNMLTSVSTNAAENMASLLAPKKAKSDKAAAMAQNAKNETKGFRSKILQVVGIVGGIAAFMKAKWLMAAGGLIALTQIAMLLKAGVAKLWIFLKSIPFHIDNLMAGIGGQIRVLPEKIGLAVKKILPFHLLLSKEERKELSSLKKDKDLNKLRSMASKQDIMRDSDIAEYIKNERPDIDITSDEYNNTTIEGQENIKKLKIAALKYKGEKLGYDPTQDINDWIADQDARVAEYNRMINDPKIKEKFERLKELSNDDDLYESKQAALDMKAEQMQDEIMKRNVVRETAKGDKSRYQASQIKEFEEEHKTDSKFMQSMASAKTAAAVRDGHAWTGPVEGWAEQFLAPGGPFDQWKDAWKDLATHLSEGIGVKVQVKSKAPSNPMSK